MDIVVILKTEFKERFKKNPRYSLRAFAKSLGLSHTILSLVFSGKRNLSKKSLLKISDCLKLDSDQILNTKDNYLKKSKLVNENYTTITLENFELISNWLHYAILSLLELKLDNPNDVASPTWLANKLRVSESQAQESFKRLLDIGLIHKTEDGKWKQTGKSIKVENEISTNSTKSFHKGLLNKAIESLVNDPIKIRDFSSMTLATDPANISYAVDRIRQFRRELTAELEARGEATAVYNLTIQLYPVSKID
jgi:uncharacterized protein (TIGR02147 family)